MSELKFLLLMLIFVGIGFLIGYCIGNPEVRKFFFD